MPHRPLKGEDVRAISQAFERVHVSKIVGAQSSKSGLPAIPAQLDAPCVSVPLIAVGGAEQRHRAIPFRGAEVNQPLDEGGCRLRKVDHPGPSGLR